eukprot:UN18909
MIPKFSQVISNLVYVSGTVDT